MFHKLVIKQSEMSSNPKYAKVCVDEIPLMASSIKYEHTVNSVPYAEVGLVALPDIEHISDIRFEFKGKSISECCEFIRFEAINDVDFRKAFISSIESALKENSSCIKEDCYTFELAERIFRRIVGED